MTSTRWDPFGEMTTVRRELDRLLSRLGSSGGEETQRAGWMPRMDVRTEGNDMLIEAEVPGMRSEDIDVEVTGDQLTIKGERRSQTEKTEEGWIIRERSQGVFLRTVALPAAVEADTIEATYTDGVLRIRVPQAAQALNPPTQKVAVSSGPAQGGTGQAQMTAGRQAEPSAGQSHATQTSERQSAEGSAGTSPSGSGSAQAA